MRRMLGFASSLALAGLLGFATMAQEAIRGHLVDVKVSRPADAAQPPTKLPDPPIPVQQAVDIGLGQCAPILRSMSREALASPYDVQSGWSRSDPTHHIFQSVAALRNPANNPPDGLAALIAAPVSSSGCDGVVVQVFPLAGDCPSAQKVMLQTGKVSTPMLGTRIMLDGQGHRVILLPAFANTCIAISIDTRFGSD